MDKIVKVEEKDGIVDIYIEKTEEPFIIENRITITKTGVLFDEYQNCKPGNV